MGFNGDLVINNRDLVGFNGDVMGDMAITLNFGISE
jgi:hypothetical protein